MNDTELNTGWPSGSMSTLGSDSAARAGLLCFGHRVTLIKPQENESLQLRYTWFDSKSFDINLLVGVTKADYI